MIPVLLLFGPDSRYVRVQRPASERCSLAAVVLACGVFLQSPTWHQSLTATPPGFLDSLIPKRALIFQGTLSPIKRSKLFHAFLIFFFFSFRLQKLELAVISTSLPVNLYCLGYFSNFSSFTANTKLSDKFPNGLNHLKQTPNYKQPKINFNKKLNEKVSQCRLSEA